MGLAHGIKSIFANIEEQVLDMMRDLHQRREFHHSRGTFDRMHDAEDFIDVVRCKIFIFFGFYQKFIQLF